jgi:glycosyltransferase involved in cell wall biosynthesis
MHVVICSDGIFPASMGGIERHTRLLVESLAARHRELRLTVIHTHPGTRLFESLTNVAEIAVEPKPGRRQYLIECLELSERFANELRKVPDAIIYSQGVCVLRGIHEFSRRLIVNPHGLESFQTLSFRDWATTTPFRLVQRRTFRHARYVVSLGGRLTKILEREIGDSRRIVVLPNGVNLPSEPVHRAPRGDGPLRLLFVGRLARNKGVSDLVRAMGILDRQGLSGSITLDLAGAGPLLAQLSRDCRLPSVTFWGKVTDEQLEELYRRAHVFVLPTLFEGMPTVVLEAMARSLPALVTDVGATTELVDDANGKIIRKRDPVGLSATLRRFADMSEDTLAKLGEAGRERVRSRFTWSQVADSHARLIAQLHQELSAQRIAPFRPGPR